MRSELASQPLYKQVEALLIERIRLGEWTPGQLIPNEFELGRELGVSQGTVRKALGAMTAANLLVRRQGRGTYVVEHTPDAMLFRFFNLYDSAGRQIVPQAGASRVRSLRATAAERRALRLATGEKVVRISRTRTRGAMPFVLETISLPEGKFPGLAVSEDIPDTLYDHFQKAFGITVARGEEQVTAVLAGAKEARTLQVRQGDPLLHLERVMFDLDDTPVERRVSTCRLFNAHYRVRLT